MNCKSQIDTVLLMKSTSTRHQVNGAVYFKLPLGRHTEIFQLQVYAIDISVGQGSVTAERPPSNSNI